MAITSQAIAAAPITPSGLNTQVTLSASPPSGKTQYDITGGTRPGGGMNLFHSFGNFNVPNNNIANFLNDSGLATTNILGRVTGGNISNIFGTIQTTGFGTANLFLMNPAGFLFGPNATVNVGGMVSFSSADYLRLADGKLFNAVPNPAADGLLSTAPVAAYGFLGSNPGAITVQGSQLTVTPGQSLSLVGGNIMIHQSAKLSAQGGQISLASVASPGEILAGTLAQAPNINGQSFGNLGAIHITEQSVIDVSGNGGGTAVIRGGQFLLDNSTISANITGPGPTINGAESIGSGIDIQVSGNAVIQNLGVLETNVTGDATPGVQYGGAHVKADQIQIVGVLGDPSAPLPFTGIRSDVIGTNGGNSGNIKLEGNSFVLKDGGQLETVTQGIGNAGNITVSMNGNIEISNGAQIGSGTFEFTENGSSSGGNIALTSLHGNIMITETDPTFATLVTTQANSSTGDPGNIIVNAPHGDIILSGPTTNLFVNVGTLGGAGGKGKIQLTANNLQLNEGATISDVNASPAQIGEMTVTLSGQLSLSGQSTIFTQAFSDAPAANLSITAHDILVNEGSSISAGTLGASGAGGQLNVSTSTLTLTNGGQLTSSSNIIRFRGRELIPTGDAGNVTIGGLAGRADSVLIDGSGSGIFTATQGFGAGGNIVVNANVVTLQNGGSLSAATSGTAPSATGGTITVNANQLQVNSGGLITAATTGAGPGGSVNINAGSSFSSDAGTVSSTASQSTGGNINIAAGNSVTLTNRASVSASSTGQGSAGDIHMNAGQNFTATNSSVTTEALNSSGGIIKITTSPAGTVQLTDSTISASVNDGSGGGGSVNIDPQFVILQNSQILANAVFGAGGNISITTNLLLPDSASVIKASSQFGQQGTITIQSPISPASGKIVPLGQKPLLPVSLLSQRCAALAGGNISSFTVAGRDALPAEPGGWVSTPLALSMSQSEDGTVKEAGLHRTPSEITEDISILSLRKIAPVGFLTQSFAVSTDCAS